MTKPKGGRLSHEEGDPGRVRRLVRLVVALSALIGVWLVVSLTHVADSVGPSDPGVYCYLADDSAVIHVRLTIGDSGRVSGISKWSGDRGANFDHTVSFVGTLRRDTTGASMILDLHWRSEGELVEVTESWTFVQAGFRTGNRIYEQVDCSVVDGTFAGRG